MAGFTALVPAPQAHEVNTNVEPCPTSLIITRRGLPRAKLTDKCQPPTISWWANHMETLQVGPFRATGFEPFLRFFDAKLQLVRAAKPDLYKALGTAGCLCIRHVRGRPGVPSNHCFGMAIDMKIEGVIDYRGDGQIQVGMLELWKIIKCPELYWGVEFRIEDGMHIEASRRLVKQWIAEGLI